MTEEKLMEELASQSFLKGSEILMEMYKEIPNETIADILMEYDKNKLNKTDFIFSSIPLVSSILSTPQIKMIISKCFLEYFLIQLSLNEKLEESLSK